MEPVYIGLGSNLGRRRESLRRGIEAMGRAGIRVRRCSSLWESEPVDAPGTPWFLNMAVEAETGLEPRALLASLLAIERDLGRERALANAPRTLDLDLLLYGARLADEPRLRLPHPRMWQRRFVLAPLAEIAPSLTHPQGGPSVRQLLDGLPTQPIVKQIGSLRVAGILAPSTRQ